MPDWAEESLRDAIEHLVRAGRNDLASDLSRISSGLDFTEFAVLRCAGIERLVDAALEAESVTQIALMLGQIAKAMSLQHCTLHVISESATTSFLTKVITTYPHAWVSRYLEKRYSAVDPVGRACMTATAGFFWGDLSRRSPIVDGFWKDFTAHGLSAIGYTEPFLTERGDKLALSVCSRMDQDRFYQHIDRFQADLAILGISLGEAFCRLASETRPTSFNPTDEQIELLRAIAGGVDEAELRISTARFACYEKLSQSICELFRTRTVSAAAVLAARIGLLHDAPLCKTDILTMSQPGFADVHAGDPVRRPVRSRNLAAANHNGSGGSPENEPIGEPAASGRAASAVK